MTRIITLLLTLLFPLVISIEDVDNDGPGPLNKESSCDGKRLSTRMLQIDVRYGKLYRCGEH